MITERLRYVIHFFAFKLHIGFTIPILLGVGMPPQTALGTNKLQPSFGPGR